MRTIIYAGGELVTGDAIAAALLDYAAALAESDTADTVDFPVRSDDGSTSTATILIGPASQIMLKEADHGVDELVDAVVVTQLSNAARSLRPEAKPESEPSHVEWSEEY
jgi:chaperonin GroEL (HSP60 family)